MILFTNQIDVPANSTIQNVLQNLGARVRTIPQGYSFARLTLFATGEAAGLQLSFFVGSRNPIETSVVNALNRIPIVPDDLIATDMFGTGNDQLQLQATNTTGGALFLFFRLEVEQMSEADVMQNV
jgi:hypothetical protein